MDDIIGKLEEIIADRKRAAPAGSYTTSLFAAGLPRIAQKVGEEGVETVVAALSQGEDRVAAEMADLIYHCLVLLAAREMRWSDVEAELARRFR
jgi:phosphoribosyl-ATP pyrophosphohydrolase/phosphoribosyl-AMP cyclohydrolase